MATKQTRETYQRNTKNIWFPYQKEPNAILEHDLFVAYWQQEKDRCLNGFYLANGQVYISGWLYWHTVYWSIELSTTINGKDYKTVGTPTFRDTDWEMSINKEEAEKQKRIIELVGARGFGKTVWDASIAGYYYTFFDDLEICISGAYANDIKIVTDKIETGLTNLHPVFRKQRLQSNWKMEVRAGFKDKKTGSPSDESSNSRIVIRNFEEGNNTMACNGLRPKFHVIDEIGKIRNLKPCVLDTVPCWINEKTGDYMAVVILSGTGGDMEVGQDAGEIFFNPGEWNILEFDDVWENRGKIGWFMPATKALSKFKDPKKLSEFLGIKHADLDNIDILVSNEEKVIEEFIKPRRKKAEKAGQAALTKEKAYYPLTPSESFLVISQNPFNTDNAKHQQIRLKENGIKGIPVKIIHDGTKLIHEVSHKQIIEKFPSRSGDMLDAPIMMYEPPITNPPWGLYVAGIDPYNQEDAVASDSLGACYIFKRIHSISSELYQDMIVASYVARPDSIFDWYENVRNMLKYYNAIALCENENVGFIQYMKLKNDDYLLANQPDWLKEIHPNSDVDRKKGLHVTPKIRQYLNTNLKAYLDEVINEVKDPKTGSIISSQLGIHKVIDPILLEEIIKYNSTGNFDRIVAASLAITYARSLDPMIKTSRGDEIDSRYKSYFNKERKIGGSSMFDRDFKMRNFGSTKNSKLKNKIFL